MINTKKCLICNKGLRNDCLYWHLNPDSGEIWCWCNKCNTGRSIYTYTALAGLSLTEFLQGEFDFIESRPNEVRKMDWPAWFISLSDPRARKGADYVKSRGLEPEGEMYYDLDSEAIVFPYYYESVFVGAQMRFLKPIVLEDGGEQKISTLPGTRLGLVFYGWNQDKFMRPVKAIVVTEGAFNAQAIQQSLNTIYGGVYTNPWQSVACSGSGATVHHLSILQELKEAGYRIIAAPDPDDAGKKMLSKFIEAGAATHVALPENEGEDWNDVLKRMGKQEFAQWFLKRVEKV